MGRAEEIYTNQNSSSIVEFFLPMVGVVVDDIQNYYEENQNIVAIRGKSIDRNDEDFLPKLMPCLSPIIINNTEVDLVKLSLYDYDDIEIGSIQLIAKYIRRFKIAEEKYKIYEMLLINATTQITYVYTNNQASPSKENDLKLSVFVIAILNSCMPLIEKLISVRVPLVKDAESNINIIEDVHSEFKYISEIINEFVNYEPNNNLLIYVREIVSTFVFATDKLVKSQSKLTISFVDEMYLICSHSCTKISELFATEGELQEMQKIVDKSSEIDHSNLLFSTVGRNDSCPCGSGKKYKRCCMK